MTTLGTATAFAETESFDVDGIEVILKSNPGTPVVSATFVLRGGVPYYTPERAGIELMLFDAALKGTKNFPKQQLQQILARSGTNLGTDALHDYTSLNMTCLRRDLDEAWAVFADVVVNPTFDAAEVALVKERQLNDVRQAKDDADSYLRILADELHYAGHPYAAQPGGTEASVVQLNTRVLKDYHSADVTRARSLVVIVGDVDRMTAERLVRDDLLALPLGSYTEPVLVRPGEVSVAETHLEPRELPTNYVRGYYRTPSLYEDDYVDMMVGLRILRDRLFTEVRTKRNMTYAVSAGMASRRDNYGLLYVTAVEPDTTLRVMLHEVEKMQTEGPTEKELRDHLKVMITDYLMDQQTNASQAAELAKYEVVGGGWKGADLVVEGMRDVTVDDIQRVCKKYIQNIDFVMLGDPQKWKDPLAADQPASSGSELH
jgi:zinc protease